MSTIPLAFLLGLFTLLKGTLTMGATKPTSCDHTPNALRSSSMLQTQYASSNSIQLKAVDQVTNRCGHQQVIQAFDTEHTLNALLLDPESKGLGFIHIPQNGGDIIEAVGSKYGQNWGFHAINHTFVHKVQMSKQEVCSWFLVPPRYLPGVKLYTNKKLFCVIREPTERLFATYLSLMKFLNTDCPLSEKDAAILNKYGHCSAASLNYFVREALDGSEHDFDCKLMPQYKYIWDWDGKQVCDEILEFEELPTALPTLLQKYNITSPSDVPTVSLGDEGSICPGLTLADLDVKSTLLISQYYRYDFEKLGYL
jgi:hypothetical protein